MANNNPGFIKNYPLAQVKQGYYRVDAVEEFRKQAYTAYAECYARNKELADNFRKVERVLDEYKEGKDRIATTMMAAIAYSTESKQKADAEAKEIVDEAAEKADGILEEKKAQADSYYEERTKLGDEYYSKAKTAYEDVMTEVKAKAQEYVQSVNEAAEETVKKANENAALIVSRAYADAQKARDAVDEILEKANGALPKAKNDLARFKLEVTSITQRLEKLLSVIEVPEDIDFKAESEEKQDAPKMDSAAKFAYEVPLESVSENTQDEQEQLEEKAEILNDNETFLSNVPDYFSTPDEDKSDVDVFSDSRNVASDENADVPVSDESETASDYIFDRFSSLSSDIISGDSPDGEADPFANLFNS